MKPLSALLKFSSLIPAWMMIWLLIVQVWGLTAAILIQTASIAFGRNPLFSVESESGGCLTQVHLDADGNVTPGRPSAAMM